MRREWRRRAFPADTIFCPEQRFPEGGAGIICIAAGFISIGSAWTILAGAGFSFLLNLIFINLMLLQHSKNPRFNWDSETEFSRKLGFINFIVIVIGLIMFIFSFGVIVFAPMLNGSYIMMIASIICILVLLIALVLALMVNSLAVKKVAKNLMKLE